MSYGFLAESSAGRIQIDETHPVMVVNQAGTVTLNTASRGKFINDVAYSANISGRGLGNSLVFVRPHTAPASGSAVYISGNGTKHPPGQTFRFTTDVSGLVIDYLFVAPSQYTTILDTGDYGLEVYAADASLLFSSNMQLVHPLEVVQAAPATGTTIDTYTTWGRYALLNSSYGYQYAGGGSTWTLQGDALKWDNTAGTYKIQMWYWEMTNRVEDQYHTSSAHARLWATGDLGV
jgi:hypothetical protein